MSIRDLAQHIQQIAGQAQHAMGLETSRMLFEVVERLHRLADLDEEPKTITEAPDEQ